MADATTQHYGWSKPTNGADSGSWGTTANNTTDAIDAQMFANASAAVQTGGPGQTTSSANLGGDTGGYSVRVAIGGQDRGYILRTNFGAGVASGGLVTISTGSPSGTPNDGDLWLQYS